MTEWFMLQGKKTLHVVRFDTTLCGMKNPSVVARAVTTNNSRCPVCRSNINCWTSTEVDNQYMIDHFRALGLDSSLRGRSRV